MKETVNVKEMVKIKSPVYLKDLEGNLGVSLNAIMAKGVKKELLDTDKIMAIELKKGECVTLLDSNDNLLELCRDKKGRHSLKKLEDIQAP